MQSNVLKGAKNFSVIEPQLHVAPSISGYSIFNLTSSLIM